MNIKLLLTNFLTMIQSRRTIIQTWGEYSDDNHDNMASENADVKAVGKENDITGNDKVIDLMRDLLILMKIGKISKLLDKWKSLTSYVWVLDIIKGYQIEFELLPRQRSIPNELVFSLEERICAEQEIQKFLESQ